MTKATGPLFVVHFKRRRKGKTDYAKRLALLKSGTPRLVVRKSNSGISAQFTEFTVGGDKVIASATSNNFKQFEFDGKCNTPSAYLVGFLAGRKAMQKGLTQFTLDIGLHTASKGSVLFAVLKGAIDAGLKTNYDESVLPSQQRIEGKHLSESVQTTFKAAFEKIKTSDLQQVGKVKATSTKPSPKPTPS